MEDLIRVRNICEKVWKDSHAGREYIIPPGDEREIPRDAYYLWFGHPGVKDQEREKQEAKDRRGDYVFEPWPCLEILRGETLSYEEMVEKYEKSPAPEEPAAEKEPEFPDLDAVLPPKPKPRAKK
jgi:hypothetical protein